MFWLFPIPFFRKKRVRPGKKDWEHMNTNKIEVMLYYAPDSGIGDYTCRYKVVSGRVKKRFLERKGDWKKVIMAPTTKEAVVLVWRRYEPSGGKVFPLERFVVHLHKNFKPKKENGVEVGQRI